MRQIGIATMQEVRDILRAVYPHDEIPGRSEERIEACLRKLGEEREPDARPPAMRARDVGNER
ncbi:MAG: hypothetical protein OXJ37_13060 [Bryobacterales bacterium]|nr:hypothetical protein [Bryobacterales bacterium]